MSWLARRRVYSGAGALVCSLAPHLAPVSIKRGCPRRDGVTAELKESLVRWDRFADQRFGESEEDEDGNVTFPAALGKRKRNVL